MPTILKTITRLEKFFSQKDLSRLVGVNARSIRRYKQGTRTPAKLYKNRINRIYNNLYNKHKILKKYQKFTSVNPDRVHSGKIGNKGIAIIEDKRYDNIHFYIDEFDNGVSYILEIKEIFKLIPKKLNFFKIDIYVDHVNLDGENISHNELKVLWVIHKFKKNQNIKTFRLMLEKSLTNCLQLLKAEYQNSGLVFNSNYLRIRLYW